MAEGQNWTDLAMKSKELGGHILVCLSSELVFVGGSVWVHFAGADQSERSCVSVSTCKENPAFSQ